MKNLNNGFLFLGTYVIIALLLYIAGPEIFVNPWVSSIRGFLMLGVLIFIALNIRKSTENGFINFKNLFTGLFITVATYSVLGLLFDIVLFKLIAPDFMDRVKEISIENMYNASWIENMSDAQIDNMIEGTEERFDKAFTPLGLLFTFGFKLVSWTIISLILAAIFKKKEPDFA